MDNLTSLDIHALLEEIRPRIIDSKVETVQHIGDIMVLKLFKNERFDLVISSGIGFWISQYKHTSPKTPSSFCMLLRKKLKGQRVTYLAQHGFDRVIEIGFSDGMRLIAEFFAKGNIILCDADYTILQALIFKEFGSRSIKPKKEYLFPKSENDLLTMSKEEFSRVISGSNKEIVKALVRECNLAGHYSESVLAKTGINKSAFSSDISEKGLSLLYASIRNLITLAEERNCPNISEELVLPVELPAHKPSESFDSFDQAVDVFFSTKKKPSSGKKREKILRAMQKQEKAITDLGEKIVLEKQAGNLVAADADEVNAMITAINSAKKKHSIQEIQQIIEGSPYAKKMIKIEHDKIIIEL